MDKVKVLEKYGKSLLDDEALIGHIHATSSPAWRYLFGPLGMILFNKFYVLVVSDKKIHFNRLNQLGKIALTDSFTYDEIERLEMKKGMVKYTLRFYFKNGNKLRLRAQHMAFSEKIREKLISSQALSHLQEKFQC